MLESHTDGNWGREAEWDQGGFRSGLLFSNAPEHFQQDFRFFVKNQSLVFLKASGISELLISGICSDRDGGMEESSSQAGGPLARFWLG